MGCAASSSVAKHGSPVQAAFKRDPVCIDVPQPLVEEEDESRDLLMPLPTPTLLTSKGKSSPVAEDKVQKDDRGADEEDSVSSAAESRARFMIEGVDVRPYLPTVLPASTVLGALCMLWVQLPALHVYAPAQVCFGTLFLLTMWCMAYCAYADPGQMQETVDVEQGMPQRAHKSWQYPLPILRHDHYCKWINNVIGLRNHRSFVVMLFGLAALGVVGCTVDAWLFMALLIQEGIYVTPLQFFFLFFHLLYSLTLLYLDGPIIRIHWGLICRNELNQEWKEDAFWVAPGESHTPAKELGVEEYNALLDSDSLVYDASRNHFDQGVARNCWTFWFKERSGSLGEW